MKTIAIALYAVLLGASAQASTPSSALANVGHIIAVCDDGSSSAQGCSDRRCLYVEPWVGARTAGPTFPTACRPVASLLRNPVA